MATKQPGENGQFDVGEDFLNFLHQQQAPQQVTPGAGDPNGGGETGGDGGNAETPRDRIKPGTGAAVPGNPDFMQPKPQPGILTPPSPEAGMGSSTNIAPNRPQEPTPSAGGSPIRLPAPQPRELLGSGMLGSSGGLTGGGIGAAGDLGKEGMGDSLLPLLLQLLQSGQ